MYNQKYEVHKNMEQKNLKMQNFNTVIIKASKNTIEKCSDKFQYLNPYFEIEKINVYCTTI